jgi:hypothetical protein
MRPRLFLLALLLNACREQDVSTPNALASTAAAESAVLTYAGQGRDRLCLDERAARVGLIIYGEADANCSLRGTVQRAGARITIKPDGDESCQIAGTIAGTQVSLGPRTPECAYYCGPTADYSGRSFTAVDGAGPVTDFAGDPLC